jgi:hypothetical protein
MAANFILLAGGVGIASLIVFARPLTGLVAPGFTGPGEVDTLVRLIRIILPAQIFLVIGGLLSAALGARCVGSGRKIVRYTSTSSATATTSPAPFASVPCRVP